MTEEILTTIGIGVGLILLALIIFRIRKIFEWFGEVINDTCKGKDGKWSLTSIMMIAAFNLACGLIIYDEIKQGKLNEWCVIALLTLATTGKIATAQAKKIDPTVLAPKEDEQK